MDITLLPVPRKNTSPTISAMSDDPAEKKDPPPPWFYTSASAPRHATTRSHWNLLNRSAGKCHTRRAGSVSELINPAIGATSVREDHRAVGPATVICCSPDPRPLLSPYPSERVQTQPSGSAFEERGARAGSPCLAGWSMDGGWQPHCLYL